jgi:hypothetical protein
MMRRS